MSHLLHNALNAVIESITFLFVVGSVGCVAVLVLTFWQDLKTLIGHEE